MGLKSYFKLIRVNQWIKNLFVLAPIIFSSKILIYDNAIYSITAFIVFCLASSSVYILNDILDAENDKKHPIKKFRPIANNDISKPTAIIMYILFLSLSLIIAYIQNIILLYIILTFIFLNILYSVYLKYIVILDVLFVSIGYVLRLLAGSIPLKIYLSPWIIISTLTLTLMIAIAKRYSELLNHDSKEQRAVLELYDKDFLQVLLVLTSGLTIIIYLIWCIEDPLKINIYALVFSSIFVFYGILRYLYLTIKIKATEDPSTIFTKDIPLILNGLIWVIYMFILVYFLDR